MVVARGGGGDERTLELEGEVFGEVAALVVAAQQEQRRRVRELQRPQVQHTLRAHAHEHMRSARALPTAN